MTTIAQTLLDIENLQQDIDRRLHLGEAQRSRFIDGLVNVTQAYHFDLLAHSILATAKAKLAADADVLVSNYYALSDKTDIHGEYIRLLNIGGLFTVWALFEDFVRATYAGIFETSKVEDIKEAYKAILKSKKVDRDDIERMIGEFNVIRFIRSVLSRNDVYLSPKTRSFVLGKETYRLKKDEPIKPIRLMTVIGVIWRHYVTMVLS
jgi:hypothetical protein